VPLPDESHPSRFDSRKFRNRYAEGGGVRNLFRSLVVVAATATSIVQSEPAFGAAPAKIGTKCNAAQWGASFASNSCVRIGRTTYVLASLPSATPPLLNLATGRKLGRPCDSTEWGQQIGPYLCARTGRTTYVLVSVPNGAAPLSVVGTTPPETPVATTPPIETTSLPATQATAPATTVSPTTAPAPPPTTAAETTSPPTVPPQSARRFANCTELNAVYPHGVGRTGASDQSSGKPVTTFTVDDAVYEANKGSDRDGDGIACEKA
jgi:Excalibur calcium-binding domain